MKTRLVSLEIQKKNKMQLKNTNDDADENAEANEINDKIRTKFPQ